MADTTSDLLLNGRTLDVQTNLSIAAAAAAAAGAAGAFILRRFLKGPQAVRTQKRYTADEHFDKSVSGARPLVLQQNRTPLESMSLYMDGFHFHADDIGRQVEAHHYCSKLNDDIMQCAIFDSSSKSARLIGVEYVISANLFRSLSDEEKRLWHSHQYEVTSGTLLAPGMPDSAEHKVMKHFITTYGKTWFTWDTQAHDDLPLGPPMLMMAFTSDGQLHAELEAERADRLNLSSHSKRIQRRDIRASQLEPGCDDWLSGKAARVSLADKPVVNLPQ